MVTFIEISNSLNLRKRAPKNYILLQTLIFQFQTDYGPLKTLTASGMLKPHSRKCRCSICRDESPKTTPEKLQRNKKRSTLSDDDENENDFEEKEKEEQAEDGDGEQQEEEENVSAGLFFPKSMRLVYCLFCLLFILLSSYEINRLRL